METASQDIDLVVPGTSSRTAVRTAPSAPGPHPGVVMIHEAFGLDANLRVLSKRMADAGYLVLAPDLFGPGNRLGCLRRTFADLGRRRGTAFDVIAAAQQALRADPACTGRVGVIGFCLGGGFALVTANDGFSVSSVNYGRLPKDLDASVQGACPIVGSYGGRDSTLRGAAATLDSALTRAGVEHDVKEYPTAGHAFLDTEPVGPRLLAPLLAAMHMGSEPRAAEDAWHRIDTFFAQHLRD